VGLNGPTFMRETERNNNVSYLLAGGDSFTDPNFEAYFNRQYDTSYSKWPEVLAKQLKISRVINVGRMGGSNQHMFDLIVDQIIVKPPKVVVVLLTAWDRITPYGCQINPLEVAALSYEKNKLDQIKNQSNSVRLQQLNDLLKEVQSSNLMSIHETMISDYMTVDSIVNGTLRNIYLLQQLCKSVGADLLIAQGIDPIVSLPPEFGEEGVFRDRRIFHHWNYLKVLLQSPYFNQINWDKVTIGGPFFIQVGGISILHLLYDGDRDDNDQPLLIPNDGHPNKKGHEFIADIFFKDYQEKYL